MVKAIVGANWGDEGKGKITDVLAGDSDVVIRFQGGSNAGHTIVNEHGRFALHQLPSGVFYPHVTNLIGNALKHGSKTLDIRLYQEGQTLVTAFSNDAPELTQEDLPRVFERFYTADQMRTGQNTGLGLAIVKALSEQMGHTAFADLKDGVFTVGVRWKL